MHSKEYTQLINSWRWQKLRRAKITRDPLCEECLKRGRGVRATEVHHIAPVESARGFEQMKVLAYDPHNLMSLCAECHDKIHAEMNNRGTRGKRRQDELDAFARKWLGVKGGGAIFSWGGTPLLTPRPLEKRNDES